MLPGLLIMLDVRRVLDVLGMLDVLVVRPAGLTSLLVVRFLAGRLRRHVVLLWLRIAALLLVLIVVILLRGTHQRRESDTTG
jgi:hypothetical protein